jgi:hypothetical protein
MKYTLLEWQNTYKGFSNLIVQASAKDGSDSWQPFPIGMQYAFARIAHQLGEALQIGLHEFLVISAISDTTDENRRKGEHTRKNYIATLQKNGIFNDYIHPNKYFQILPHVKFVISPEGNGIDCHRHYEALMAGCIPIIEHNPLIEEKYKGCPVLYTKDYSEITEEYLNKKYEEMIDKEYDFSCLFLSYYTEEQQKDIKECGNYWLNQNMIHNWY